MDLHHIPLRIAPYAAHNAAAARYNTFIICARCLLVKHNARRGGCEILYGAARTGYDYTVVGKRRLHDGAEKEGGRPLRRKRRACAAMSGRVRGRKALSRNGSRRITGPVSKAVSGALGAVFSLIPRVPAAELCVYLLAALLLTRLVMRLCGRARGRGRSWLDRAGRACLACAGALCFFVFAWGLNYYAAPLSDSLGLPVRGYGEQELFEAAEHYLDQANQAAEAVERRSDGTFDNGGYAALAERAPDAMRGPCAAVSVF